ncbi:MAG: M1 family metallopeptidase [Bacteroidetes bacterium]|nr:M1 family metallopeptidase [Bacteroidota bacterium]
MKFNLLIAVFLLFSVVTVAQDISTCSHRKTSRTAVTGQALDYDVSHIGIYIDSINFSGQQLQAMASITVKAVAVPVSQVNFDLLGFNIDSISISGYGNTYTYNDTVITINISPVLAIGDSAVVNIYYHGSPAQDQSGWGGFYFSGTYAFNLGVGFDAEPHNYGRAWYPCIDNFTSRSLYDFYISTPATSKAFCNGILQQSTVLPNGRIQWHWKMSQTIPSYLVSMAVAPYYTLQRTSNGIPVEWAALPTDTPLVLGTFATLDTALSSYITAYGPYPFDKVGYCLIPFNSGAMEHASSIHIGRAFVNGSNTYATLWAHELSHMWWGDKVTCATAEDMWLNEGFATYNEAFYTEKVSGIVAYRDWIRINHRKVLQFAHTPAQDGSYLTMNNIPHTNTYGFHVYQKGADVVHTLRNYMGDSAFFAGTKQYMNSKAFSAATSADLRDELTAGSGINMNRFFDDWIFTPGFPHFSIDSAYVISGGLDHVYLFTRQRSKGNNHIYSMPVEITFSDGIQDTTVTIIIDSLTNSYHIPLLMLPTWMALDRNEKVSDAIVANERIITSTAVVIVNETNVTLYVQNLGVSPSLVRIEHHFVPPDPFLQSNPGIRLSDYHYWSVNGNFTNGFLTKGLFVYDGSTNGTTGYLDNTFITGSEDSLVFLYRPGAGFNWQVLQGITHAMGTSPTDKRGSFTVDTLLIGEYTLGYYDYTVGISENTDKTPAYLTITPNPGTGEFHLSSSLPHDGINEIIIYDSGGREVIRNSNLRSNEEWVVQLGNKTSGLYNAVLFKDNNRISSLQFVLSK